ncbi:MAG: hypothetical protein AAGG51_08435 [Cyanobacteria bacterium P01_G01_bin.54]
MTPTIITQKDLRETHGWSRYLIRMLCKNVSFKLAQRSLRLDSVGELKREIEVKLDRSRIQEKTRQTLLKTHDNLSGKSNVIQVDFLQKLPADQRLAMLMREREQLREQGNKLLEKIEVDRAEARQLR